MNIKNAILVSLFLIGLLVIATSTNIDDEDINSQKDTIELVKNLGVENPIPIEMYENLEKYSDEYDIPKYVFYNIAFLETGYKGPFDWGYKPDKTSSAGALGPMQIMPSTANSICKEKIPLSKIKNDIQFNIETSAKLLRKLHNKYGDWKIVCGCYNTGKPIVNSYAVFCSTNKNYRNNWVKP